MKNLSILLAVLTSIALSSSCSPSSYRETDHGIILKLQARGEGDPELIRLECLSDGIIRVSAVPGGDFPQRESLVVLSREATCTPRITEKDEYIELQTDQLRVEVSTSSGALRFYDADGGLLLEEVAGGGKSFKAIEVDGYRGYSMRQVFESPGDEAFFGLGQHQSDEWNYKGKNEVLYQYNTKVSVPFVISNKHYGILWDNYSLTKYGNPGPYQELEAFTLCDQDGEEGGLTATYTTAEGEVFSRRQEGRIDYESLSTQQHFPEDFPFEHSEITWEGKIEVAQSGEYEFKLYYAGYTTVHLAGEEVVAERWRTAWNPNTYKFRVRLEAGKPTPIKLHWKPDGGVSYIGLKALGPLDPVEQGRLSLWSEMGQELDYYFIHGDNMDQVISGYRHLSGKAPIMPQWAYGFWQSRERYKTQEEIVSTLAEFRRRAIPIDNIVQDWSYWELDQWGSHEFDPSRFPDPASMMKDIHDMHAHVMISVWPKFYIQTEHYKELDEKGWIYPLAVQDSIRDWIYPGYIGSFYDAYAPGAQKLFWEQMNEHLYSLGIDAWWMDASEPDILSNARLEYRKALSGPTALGSSTEFLNTYSLVNAHAIFNGQREVDPNKRVFLLTRSGFAGLQRYSTATWSGDIGTRWEDMKAQITAGMNFALSGIPYWTMDIGGFCVERRYERAREGSADLEEWRELNTRWYQFGTFAPLYRSHGQYPFREVFHIAPEQHPAYRSIVAYNKLRYRLMPYLYSLGARVHFDDYTLMRALVMDFPEDDRAVEVDDQFLFGPSIMVSPVYEYKARQRKVYLPASAGWYELETGTYLDGGKTHLADAPYEHLPLHVPAGAIIPTGPEIQYVGEKPEAPLTLWVYQGADGAFTLYEDDGLSYNYEQGDFSMIPISYDDASGKLVIGARKGNYEGMALERTFHVMVVSQDSPQPMDFSRKPDHRVQYSGDEISIDL